MVSIYSVPRTRNLGRLTICLQEDEFARAAIIVSKMMLDQVRYEHIKAQARSVLIIGLAGVVILAVVRQLSLWTTDISFDAALWQGIRTLPLPLFIPVALIPILPILIWRNKLSNIRLFLNVLAEQSIRRFFTASLGKGHLLVQDRSSCRWFSLGKDTRWFENEQLIILSRLHMEGAVVIFPKLRMDERDVLLLRSEHVSALARKSGKAVMPRLRT